MSALNILAPAIGLAPACAALRVNRAGIYRQDARRRHLLRSPTQITPRSRAPLALSESERRTLLDVLYSERFADCAPRTVYARLLDEGRYLGSVRTMYRLLEGQGQSGERRNQRVHPAYVKPHIEFGVSMDAFQVVKLFRRITERPRLRDQLEIARRLQAEFYRTEAALAGHQKIRGNIEPQ